VFISGELQFGNLPHGQPFGDFTFLRDETQLELSLVRPSLLSLLDITIHGVPLTGQLNFFAGENTRLRYEIIDDEPHLFIDATDREVLVTNCECGGESVDPITMLNGIPAASDGSFTLLEGECITATPGRHSVSLNNPCSDPCCGCKESAALEASITPLGSQVKTVAGFSERLGSEIEALGFASLRTDLGRHCDLWAEPPDIPEELKNEP